eukprot:7386584-Prymnesium_polylepis.1
MVWWDGCVGRTSTARCSAPRVRVRHARVRGVRASCARVIHARGRQQLNTAPHRRDLSAPLSTIRSRAHYS